MAVVLGKPEGLGVLKGGKSAQRGRSQLRRPTDRLRLNPEALLDNVTIAITSATGQLFIYYTIRKFGPVVFTIIMTTRQIFSMVLSAVSFGHEMGPMAYVGTTIVFGTIFLRIRRTNRSRG